MAVRLITANIGAKPQEDILSAAFFRRHGPIALAVLSLAAGLTVLDQSVDGLAMTRADLALDFADRLLVLVAVWIIVTLVLQVTRLGQDADRLRHELAQVSNAARDWRLRSRRLLDGLSEAIGHQFAVWGLTPAEAEIAGLMLKGLPLADIAALRRTSEATIRQQAQGIYRKSGLANRAELAAYFLEDLFDVAEAALPEPLAATVAGSKLN